MNKKCEKILFFNQPFSRRSFLWMSAVALWGISGARAFAEGVGSVLKDKPLAQSASGWRTVVPKIYLIDYGSEHQGNEAWLKNIADTPPDILHVGSNDLSFKSHLGAWDPIVFLKEDALDAEKYFKTPEQMRVIETRVKQFTKQMYDAGVTWLIPYICNQTILGNYEKQNGFWVFYKHWDDYKEFGFGDKPTEDPIEWMQRHPDGRLHFTYPFDLDYVRPFNRYQPCFNNENWVRFLMVIVERMILTGYNGVFVDNCIIHCHCKSCRSKFRDYLTERYTPKELEKLFRFRTKDDIEMDSVDLLSRNKKLREETIRFWGWSIGSFLKRLKEHAEALSGKEFLVEPNWGSTARVEGAIGRAEDGKDLGIMQSLSDVQYQMLEEDHDPGHYGSGIYFDYLYAYRYCHRLKIRPVVLPYLNGSEETRELAYAEAAAAGGGAYVDTIITANETRRVYKNLYRKHPELFDKLFPYADVGVYLNWAHLRFADRSHLRAFFDLHRRLTEDRFLVDVITPDFDGIDRLPVLFIGNAVYVSKNEHAALEKWVRDGGILILIGDFARYDDLARAPSADLTLLDIHKELKQKAGKEGYAVVDSDKGKVIFAQQAFPALFDANATDLNAAIEGREEKMFQVAAELAKDGKSAVPVNRNSPFLKLIVELTGGAVQPVVTMLNDYLGLKFTAYRDGKRLVLHALNYNAPVKNAKVMPDLPPAPQPFAPMRNIPISIRPGTPVKSVQAINTRTLVRETLQFQNDGERCNFIIPEVIIYTIIEITF
ncbi:MAG: alpha-amylase family protein [bacterium]